MPPRACEYLVLLETGTEGFFRFKFALNAEGRFEACVEITEANDVVTNGVGNSFGKKPRSRISNNAMILNIPFDIASCIPVGNYQ